MIDQAKKEEIIYEDESKTSGDDDLGEIENKVKKLKEKLKKCNEEKQEYLAGWQRTQADFINYRRRQEEQAGEWMKMAKAGLINDLLFVLDALDVAIRNQESGIGNKELDGLIKLHKQMKEILEKHGLEKIKAEGEKFNPELHEAIEQIESDKEEGIVIEEAQKGYLLNGKVIRTSKVKVTKK